MPARKTTTTHGRPTTAQVMGEGAVNDIVQKAIRDAIRTQARELEKFFSDIDERLTALEEKR